MTGNSARSISGASSESSIYANKDFYVGSSYIPSICKSRVNFYEEGSCTLIRKDCPYKANSMCQNMDKRLSAKAQEKEKTMSKNRSEGIDNLVKKGLVNLD